MKTQKVSVHRHPDSQPDEAAQQRATDLVRNVLDKLEQHASKGYPLTELLWGRQRKRLRKARASGGTEEAPAEGRESGE